MLARGGARSEPIRGIMTSRLLGLGRSTFNLLLIWRWPRRLLLSRGWAPALVQGDWRPSSSGPSTSRRWPLPRVPWRCRGWGRDARIRSSAMGHAGLVVQLAGHQAHARHGTVAHVREVVDDLSGAAEPSRPFRSYLRRRTSWIKQACDKGATEQSKSLRPGPPGLSGSTSK